MRCEKYLVTLTLKNKTNPNISKNLRHILPNPKYIPAEAIRLLKLLRDISTFYY